MKRFLFCVIALASGTASAEAAPFCASPGELKLLKAAVLEQALTAAAQSCRLDAEFNRFVAAYHQGMVESDRALKVFFSHHHTGEDYQGYKARIAATLAQKSLHDPAFCGEAKRVFAIALTREHAPPPHLIATGYEQCRLPAQTQTQTAAMSLSPARRAAPPAPVLPPEAEKALALAPHGAQARAMPPVPALRPAPAMKMAVQKPATPARHITNAALPRAMEESASSSDPIPNAYKRGAYWVVRDGSSTDDRSHPPSPYMFQGPDGHWIVVTGSDGPQE